VHCLQFQGVSAPDGMIVDFFGPLPRVRHDQYLIDKSKFNERLAAYQQNNNLQYKSYSDKGYIAQSHLHVAYRGRILPQPLIDANIAMSAQRIGVE